MKKIALCIAMLCFTAPGFGQNNNPSLYSETASSLYLFRDVRARSVNDIVTINVVENDTGTNSTNTSTTKGGSVSVSAQPFLGIKTPASFLQGASALDFTGTGSTSRTGQLNASMSARVMQVLPNGDLIIEGTKQLTINGERQILTVRGTIRQIDITTGNVVLSTSIANMDVSFSGKGMVSDTNKPALLSRLLKYILPF